MVLPGDPRDVMAFTCHSGAHDSLWTRRTCEGASEAIAARWSLPLAPVFTPDQQISQERLNTM